MFYCESVEVPADRGEIFTILSTSNTGKQLKVKIDTGARCNVLSKGDLQHIDPGAHVDHSHVVNLVAYGGQIIQTLGVTNVNFTCGTLQFHVVDSDVKPLLGLRDSVKLGFVQLGPNVHALQQGAPELTEYKDLFDCSTIGKLPVAYHMRLDPSVHPTICAPRRVPLAMKDKIIKELNRMTKLGVIKPVQEPTEWVSSMVAACKKDGAIRLCIDPVHLNKALLRPHHPMKTIEQVVADMPGAKVFSILDAKCGFWQVPLSEESSRLTTFMTPVGRYAFLRMPYGISTGSEVFQRCMEQLFEGQPCAIVVDDILIWGSTTEEHDLRLRQVMDRIRTVNLKLNPDKCRFRVSEVSYVGHLLTDQGIKPDPTKTDAVSSMPTPADKHDVQRFLGMTNYLSKFIPGYSKITAPLRQLLLQDVEWSWQEHHMAAFTRLKELLTSPPILQYFDVHQPVVVSADASQHALGAVCLQDNKPVAFASRALTETESRYAQIEKELLALVYACQKFHGYIYGHPVTIETDHHPLITILKKPLHLASARLQRMMLKLQRYNLNVVYKRGKELYLADALSRAHLPSTDGADTSEDYDVMTVEALSSRRTEELRQETRADHLCRRLSEIIAVGWPDSSKKLPHDLRQFYAIRDELTVDNGLLLRGQRFVIPHSLQRYYIRQLHQGHPGLEATKRRARETMFWPSMYQDIEHEISSSRCF
ncbi:dynein heavy chain axonemal [Labeo rohita]|uniref:Gypsy retrotransposon integrase-like protein 1 n=1 Tax=Labeo rohita TaxID=84645 RepID=A0A498P591_LABRO|nr:dynein heavy chain axonemal [Labeo rohita]